MAKNKTEDKIEEKEKIAKLEDSPDEEALIEKPKEGLAIELTVMEDILLRLGFLIDEKYNDRWLVSVPSFRFDVAQEEDLIEEIARIYGYNQIPIKKMLDISLPLSRKESDLSLNLIKNTFEK